jgi:hypothetical protein
LTYSSLIPNKGSTNESFICFFNSRAENTGALAWIGDKGLAPFRYLCNGKTVHIQWNKSTQETTIHHVASFHCKGSRHHSRTNFNLNSSSTGLIKTAFSIVLLAPGLLLGTLFKGMSYLFSDTRKNHRHIKHHLTPIKIVEIGTPSKPIQNREELREELSKANPRNRPIHNLIIYGDGNLTIAEAPDIVRMNPKKLILNGARLVHEPSIRGCFDTAINRDKWQVSPARWQREDSFAKTTPVTIVEEALKVEAPRRGWFTFKRYHMIFSVVNRAIN